MNTVLSSTPSAAAGPPAASGECAYYSVSQAAALLGVSRVSIWRWIRAGHLPVARLGHRTTRIKRQDLERLLGEGAATSPQSWVVRGQGIGTADGAAGGAAGAPRADWREMGTSEHFVQFYEADAFLLDAVKDFIGATLRAGDVGIVIATPAHRTGLEDRLRADELDVAGACACGRYVALDAAATLARIMVDGAPQAERFREVVGGVVARAVEGRRRVRIFGEMVALLALEGKHAAAVRLEELWNDLQQRHAYALFCAYPLECLAGEERAAVLGDVCAAHARVIPAESYTALPTADDRLRAIAVLQQRARSLEAALAAEAAARRAAQDALRARDEAQVAAEAATARLQALQAVTETALAHLGLEDLLRHVLDRITEVLGVDNTAILLLDESAHELRVYVARGPEEEVAGQVRVPLGRGLAGRIAATGEPLIVDDMARADPANPFLREHIRSLLGVPLRVSGRVIGVLHVGTLSPHGFTTDDLQWLQLVADRVALAIDHAHLYQLAQAERAQAVERAHQLNAIFEAVPDGVFLFGHDGEVVQTNAAARTFFALTAPPASYAAPLGERGYQTVVHDEHDHPLPEQHWPFRRVLQGEVLTGASTVALMVRTPDGRALEVDVSGAPVCDQEGQIVGAACVVRDVTERRRLERRTHDALEALLAMAQTLVRSPQGSDDADTSGQRGAGSVGQRLVELTREVLGCQRVGIITFDRQAGVQHPVAVAGLSPVQEQEWWELVDGAPVSAAPRPTDPDLVARLFAGQVLVVDMTQPLFHDQPNPFGVRTFLAAPLRVQGDIIGSLYLDYGGDDHAYTPQEVALTGAVAQLAALVLERERLVRERAAAQASELALREVNRRMDEFLSIATHELRTPLTSIHGNLQLLRQRLQRMVAQDGEGTAGHAAAVAPLHELLQRTIDQTGRLTRMMTDLLDVSRLQTGQLELHVELCDLVGLVRRGVEEARLAWPARSLTLEAPAGEVRVQADADRLGQVVANYLTNALKYSPPTRPVTVRVQPEGAVARVQVRDQGPGLTDEQQRDIWERYGRVPSVAMQDDTHAAGGSLGLGLYISRAIIAEHGGAVEVESRPGEGSTFWFALPVA